MSDQPSDPGASSPSSKELRDARRRAHEAQKKSSGKNNDKMGKKGKGDRKP